MFKTQILPFVFLVFSYRSNVLQAFHLLKLELYKIGLMQLGMVIGLVITRDLSAVGHHEPSGHVDLSANHRVLVPMVVAHDTAVARASGDANRGTTKKRVIEGCLNDYEISFLFDIKSNIPTFQLGKTCS